MVLLPVGPDPCAHPSGGLASAQLLVNILKRRGLNRQLEFSEVLDVHQLLAGPPRHLDISVVAQDQPPRTGFGVLPDDVDCVVGEREDLLQQLVAFSQFVPSLFLLGDVAVDTQDHQLVAFGSEERSDVFVVVILPVGPDP